MVLSKHWRYHKALNLKIIYRDNTAAGFNVIVKLTAKISQTFNVIAKLIFFSFLSWGLCRSSWPQVFVRFENLIIGIHNLVTAPVHLNHSSCSSPFWDAFNVPRHLSSEFEMRLPRISKFEGHVLCKVINIYRLKVIEIWSVQKTM